jgi:hypothetical protein
MSGKGYSRRAVAIGGSIAAALGITALGVTVPRLLGHRYRQSAYDDLFAQLQDRDAAVRVGRATLNQRHGLPPLGAGGLQDSKTLARALRQRLERRTLHEVTDSDLAQDSLTEVQGWVMPVTVVLLSVLAADES